MSQYIFVRHGQSQYNAELTTNLDSNLTLFGEQQAIKTGIYLKNNFPDISEYVGITSPYHRCLQTSHIIHDICGLFFQVKPGPREVMMSYDECKVVNRKDKFGHFHWHHEEDFHFFNEDEIAFVSRMQSYILAEEHPKLLVVSHGSPIRAMYDAVIGNPVFPDLHNYPDNCSVSHVKDKQGVYFNHIPWMGKL